MSQGQGIRATALSQSVNKDTVLAWWLRLGERAPVLWEEIAQGKVRVVRTTVMSVKRRPFVLAARSVGCTEVRVLLRHILPNVAGTALVMATLQVGWAILNASALTFLGVGTPPGVPEWGAMLHEGRLYLREAPWVAVASGGMLTLTVLAVNLVGDGLRDAIDPRLRV